MPVQFGIIGESLTHSFSPVYFRKMFAVNAIDALYDCFLLPKIEDFTGLLQGYPNLKGLNVTIPYKEAIIPFLDEIDSVAAQVGAVNCILIENGCKKGYNTDVIGFEKSLIPLLKPWHTKALILGYGGASKAVIYVLNKLGISFKIVARKTIKHENIEILNYEQLSEAIIAEHNLIINTTPLGMFPNIDNFPAIPYPFLSNHHLLYDLIYNPQETKFLSFGKENKASIKNGLEMLHLQADEAWKIWNKL